MIYNYLQATLEVDFSQQVRAQHHSGKKIIYIDEMFLIIEKLV